LAAIGDIIESTFRGAFYIHNRGSLPRRLSPSGTQPYGYRRAPRLLSQEQGLRPAPFGRTATDDPRAWGRAPHQRAPARAQGRARDDVRHHERLAAQGLRGNARVRLLLRDPEPRALPRERVQPEP